MGIYGDAFEKMIKPLIAMGYLYESNGELEITKDGKESLAKLWPIHEKVEQNLLRGISNEERSQLQDLLKRIQRSAVALLNRNA